MAPLSGVAGGATPRHGISMRAPGARYTYAGADDAQGYEQTPEHEKEQSQARVAMLADVVGVVLSGHHAGKDVRVVWVSQSLRGVQSPFLMQSD